MSKPGDKVVCIRLDYINGVGDLSKLSLNIGQIYIVEHVELYSVSVCGYLFGIYDETWKIRSFSDYFIPLSEWREKQIKIVLDD